MEFLVEGRHTRAGYEVDEATGCWQWRGQLLRNGYAKIKIRDVTFLAHRVSYELRHGAVPRGKVIDHLCGNRACVNPDHLEAVTHTENCYRGKGVKLTRGKAAEIRVLKEQGMPQHEIARRFGVSNGTVSMIVNRIIWNG
jgi:hypothetical protein